MTFDEFEHIISCYGSSPARWPEHLRAAAETFAAAHPAQVKDILAAEARLDAALDAAAPPSASDLLKRRILMSANQLQPAAAPEMAERKSTILQWRNVAALMLCTFGLGFGGAQIMPAPQITPEPVLAESTADTEWLTAAEDLGLADTYAWVEGESLIDL